MDAASAYPADAFIGTVLNVFEININGYPLSFMVWNILLAIAAVYLAGFSVRIWKSKKSLIIKSAVSAVWLAFLPNTAYLMTDARHIIGYCPIASYGNVCAENAWMTIFFFLFASFGWPSFVLAIRPLKSYVTKRFGVKQGILFAGLACFFSAWGVLLGLVNRFNSWELLTRPGQIIRVAFSYFNEASAALNILFVFIFLGILYAVGEKIFIISGKEKHD